MSFKHHKDKAAREERTLRSKWRDFKLTFHESALWIVVAACAAQLIAAPGSEHLGVAFTKYDLLFGIFFPTCVTLIALFAIWCKPDEVAREDMEQDDERREHCNRVIDRKPEDASGESVAATRAELASVELRKHTGESLDGIECGILCGVFRDAIKQATSTDRATVVNAKRAFYDVVKQVWYHEKATWGEINERAALL
jgi:hypothetical protein